MIKKLDVVLLALLFILAIVSVILCMNSPSTPVKKLEGSKQVILTQIEERRGSAMIEPVKLTLNKVSPHRQEVIINTSNIPDFASISNVDTKKTAFFNFMRPMIKKENQRLLALRTKIERLENLDKLPTSKKRWLLSLAEKYRVRQPLSDRSFFFSELLSKVDVLPISLTLVQAANESAWGTSRFARQANNFFGQWCFTQGCGLVPANRAAGKVYEVQKFGSPVLSVRAYMHNLNTSHHYEKLREIRSTLRLEGKPVTGPQLAQGLHLYSSRGVGYINELVNMIFDNKLLSEKLTVAQD